MTTRSLMMMMVVMIIFIAMFFVSVLLISNVASSKMVLIGRILMAITIIVSLLILTPIYGISGAAGAFVISSIVNAIFLICAYQFKIKKPI